MRSVKSLWVALAALAAVVGGPAASAQQTVDWTVMVYLNGDNAPGQVDLENASISEFNELEQVGSSANLNVVVQWDRGANTDNLDTFFAGDAQQSWTTCRRYLVVRDPAQIAGDPNAIEPNPNPGPGYSIATPLLLDLGEVDMGQEDTLVDFATWTMARFPARNYLLVLSDTGQGWQPRSRTGRGVIFDASTTGNSSDSNTSVYLTNDELRSAIGRIKVANGGTNLRALALDAGGMGILEIVYQLRDEVDYVMAPWLNRPTDGFPYNTLLTRLLTNPLDDTSLETVLANWAGDFVGGYGTGTQLLGGSQSTAVGVYRMSQVPALKNAVDTLAQALLDDLPTLAGGVLRALVQVQTGRPTDFTATSIDLRHFATLIGNEIDDVPVDTAAANVPPAVDALMVNTTFRNSFPGDLDVDNFRGIGIYFPQDVSGFDSTYSGTNDLAADTQWDELVQGMLTLFSDQNGPLITVSSPLPGATIIDNPPQIVATIVDQDAGGRVNASSVTLQLDGTAIASTAFSFDAATGVLTYNIPNPLTVTSHTFVITARDLSGNQTSATGNFRIAVPSLPAGVQTFSMPRWVTTAAQNDPSLVFGRDNFTLVRWVSQLFGSSKYRTYPDSFASFMPPDAASTLNRPTVRQPPAGLGYWVRVRQSRPVTSLPGSAVTLAQYPIVLYADPDGGAGWNMIANPFDVSAVGLASVQVQQNDGRLITFRQAIDQRLTPGVVFTYVPNAANPNAAGRYDFQDAGEGQLTRLQGHWLRANQDFVMLVNNGSRMAAGPAPAAPRSEPAGGWQLALQVDAGDAGWDEVELGASNGTADGYDRSWDVAAPPPLPGGVGLRAIHSDWGVDSGRYMRDLRGPAAGQVWDLEVVAPAGEVTVSWPSLRALPADVQLTLSDPNNGWSRALRNTSAYRFQHAGGTRSLRLTATRADGGGLALTAVTVTRGRGRGWGIGYTVTRSAQVTAVVRSLSGRELASVVGDGETGRGQLYWDGRTADGQPVPNGIYRIEVIATTADGSTARQIRIVQIVR